ncbi:MAG: hypothetical protein R3E92_14575 [Burkholderiaceae bacterium]
METHRPNATANQVLLDVVRSGVLAPSADNEHVFRFSVSEQSIDLWPSPEYSATLQRHRRVLGQLSLGAVVQNMTLRAGQLGFVVCVKWYFGANEGEGNGRLAKLILTPASGMSETADLASAIPKRHTNRKMYFGPTLTQMEIATLQSQVNDTDAVRLIWPQGRERRRLLKLIWRAESARFLDQQLHQEIFSSIRFDLSWDKTSDWALPPGALEIELPMRPLFKALRSWPMMRMLNRLGVHHLVGLRAGLLPAWQAPGLGVIATTRAPVDGGAIEVGACMQRIWLSATQLGLSIQPLAASAVLPLRSESSDLTVDPATSDANNSWASIVPNATPLMVFRIGRAKPPSVISSRRPLSDYSWSG